ncbi:MAG: phosphoribosylanthranilate isomerase [Rhodospirillales bacterium]
MMSIEVKICGLDRVESVDAAIENGADLVGFVFYPPSPRNLTPEVAAALIARVPNNVTRVGLFVDPTDEVIDAALVGTKLDLLQLHGSETPDRVTEIKQRTQLPVMKVIKLASEADLLIATDYYDVADRLLFDAKPPADMENALPGGNALAFDWKLLANADIPLSWMLAGGLNAANISEAIQTSGTTAVDVSSGVEEAPGVKNPSRIKEFLLAAKS